MDGFSRSGELQLLNLVTEKRDWFGSSHHGGGGGGRGSCEENKLELTLGPPGDNWSSLNQQHTCDEQGHESSLLSLGHGAIKAQKISSSLDHHHHHHHSGSTTNKAWPSSAKFLQFPSNAQVVEKESLHKFNSTKMAELQTRNNDAPAAAEKKGFSASGATHTAVPNTNTSQKRTAPAPVVGWPPIRSFRKNLASTKPSPPETQNGTHDKLTNNEKRVTKATPSSTAKGLFIKINMDGIPIGRKVDLNAYDSYEKLSSAVDKLFRGLLAAQTDYFANGIPSNLVEDKPITGLLDESGEYTLVYVDNEGDIVLVGDVPWGMFVSTVKRLRALKTSELASLSLGSKQQKMRLDSSSMMQLS